MAEEPTIELDSDAPVQLADHESTYSAFVGLMKYSTIAIAIVLILLAWFLL